MDESDEEALDLFQEPEGFYEKEKEATHFEYRTLHGQTLLTLRLVGQSPLWGHLLWQGGKTIADYLEVNKAALIEDKTVLELGAGAGLPSLICAIHGAKSVVVTDYPDPDLVENLQLNIDNCTALPQPRNIHARGYLWGADSSSLRSLLPESDQKAGFDLLILADLLFNHSEHGKLLSTVQELLKKGASSQALVFFTPYRPWLFEKDLAFFDIARSGGFVVEKVMEKLMDEVMFQEDRGDETLRRTVFGYRLRWSDEKLET